MLALEEAIVAEERQTFGLGGERCLHSPRTISSSR